MVIDIWQLYLYQVAWLHSNHQVDLCYANDTANGVYSNHIDPDCTLLTMANYGVCDLERCTIICNSMHTAIAIILGHCAGAIIATGQIELHTSDVL